MKEEIRNSENLMATETKKTKVKMNKPIYLGMSILDISKTLMYEFCYYYIKAKYWDRAKLCYMNTEIFVIHIKTEDFYEDIAMTLRNGLTHLIIINMIIEHFQ